MVFNLTRYGEVLTTTKDLLVFRFLAIIKNFRRFIIEQLIIYSG